MTAPDAAIVLFSIVTWFSWSGMSVPMWSPHSPLPAVALFTLCSVASLGRPAVLDVAPDGVIAAVHVQYAAVSNLSCTVRREMSDGRGGKIGSMSYVVWARGDKMNVHTVRPLEKQTVIDGETVRIKAPADDEPAVFMVTNQTATQAANLRSVPGSPEEMLAPFESFAAREVPAVQPFARTISFEGDAGDADGKAVADVSFDAEGRVARIDLREGTDEGRGRPISSTNFRGAFEALPGVWLFHRTETETRMDGRPLTLTSRFDKFSVNGTLAPDLFDPIAVFSGNDNE